MASLVAAVCLLLPVLIVLTEQANLSRRASFQHYQVLSSVSANDIRESSGICASRIHPNILYTHNDSGDYSHSIFAVDVYSGQQVAHITINGASSHDWEDIACGPCPGNNGEHCIYIADTGGNAHSSYNTIYRIKEPAQLHSQMYVNLDSTLKFSWDQHNCETMMVDPHAEVYVVSKVFGGPGKMVKLPSYAWGTSHRASANDGIYVNGIHSNSDALVGGDISPSGNEVLLKTYGGVYYYYIPDGNLFAHMTSSPQQLPYHTEKQGEGIAWEPHGNGYYTLGEGSHQPIYYYKRAG